MSNRKEKIQEVLANKDQIKALKRASRKYTDSKILTPKAFKEITGVSKELPQDTEDVIYRTIIANTYLYLDSHDDVHAPNIFTKSIQENKRQLYLKDHILSVDNISGEVLRAYEQSGEFKNFGFDSSKETQALLKDVAIYKEWDESFFNKMKAGQINQHSVGMQYIKLDLAVDDATQEEEFKLYAEILPKIGNAEQVAEQGYFWYIREAKEFETSAVALGSNPITGVLNNDKGGDDLEKIIQNFGGLEKFSKIYDQYKTEFETHSTDGAEPITPKEEPKKNSSFVNFLIK